MLKITVPATELFDGVGNFINTKEQTLQLEHSLVSLSKWEAKWHKPYLSRKAMTIEETIDYIRCMTLTQNVDPNVYKAITATSFLFCAYSVRYTAAPTPSGRTSSRDASRICSELQMSGRMPIVSET